MRAYADNVILKFDAPKEQSDGGVFIPETVQLSPVATREAEVLSSGPGYVSRTGVLIENQVKVGEKVLVPALAGQNYDFDLTVPRHNKDTTWADDRGEFRVVREDEILCVVEPD